MFTNYKAKYYRDDKILIDSACLSTDTKPTTGVANGSKCIEMDTGKRYMFNEEDSEWEELPSSGGGGGTTVEALSVTQNGTYTAPSGKAYSPVTVNVSGGSSDFSTATVTISVAQGVSSIGVKIPCINEYQGEDYIDTTFPIELNTSICKAVLYKGETSAFITTSGTVAVSGNIQQMAPNAYNITGDCTITIS